jgi:hypothetical protein
MMGFGPKLTGMELKQLVAEMKKQAVPGLAVEDMELTDDDLAELKALNGLQTLLLRGPGIKVSDEGLKHLKGLRLLRNLGLEGTAVTDGGLKELQALRSLVRLRLGGARVTDKGMDHVRDLRNLKSLRLTWTKVSGTGLAVLRSLPELETLELRGDFTDKDLPGLKGLTSLKTLRLHQTRVSDAGLEQLKGLTNLKVLSLDAHFGWAGPPFNAGIFGGGFAGAFGAVGFGGGGLQLGGGGAWVGRPGGGGAVGKPGGGGGPNLLTKWFVPSHDVTPDRALVKLAPAPVTGKGLAHLKALKGLVELNVASDKLTDDGLKELAGLPGLKKLRLFAPEVTEKGLPHLKPLKQLEVLDLRGTQVVTGLAELRALPRLRVLYLNLMPLDPQYKAMLAEARRALPRVTIHTLERGVFRGGPLRGVPLGGPGGL